MLRLLAGLVVNAVALWVATQLVAGVTLHDGGSGGTELTGSTISALLVVAVVFAVVNALVKPVVKLLSLPLLVLSLGLFSVVINALMVLFTGGFTTAFAPFGAQLDVAGFWPALWAGIVIGLVNWVLGLIISPLREER